jgi:dihydrofolate reductase
VGYIAMSLDGFIADRDGGVGWLDQFNMDGEDHGYAEFIATVDALLVGRTSYEQVLGWGWPYGAVPAYVATHAGECSGEHVAAAGSLPELDAAIRAAGHRRVWVMGGGQIQRAALDAGMFESLRIFVMPLILGGGTPLFSAGVPRRLALAGCTPRAGGVVELNYAIPE